MAEGQVLLMPGALVSWEGSGSHLSAGVSLKRVSLPDDGAIAFGAFETRVQRAFSDGTVRVDLSWPNVFGFLYPGVSLDVTPDRVTPWFYGELDLFYFPFAFATMVLFERPVVIPSVFIAVRTDTTEYVWETGVRMSFPVRRDVAR